MVTVPTLAAEYETVWNSANAPKTAMSAVAVAVGDVLVGLAIKESEFNDLGITEDGAAAWTQQQAIDTSNYTEVRLWTYPVPTSENLTVTITRTSSSGTFGGSVLRFTGSDGVGASAQAHTTGAPSLDITTEADNSAIVVAVGDWNAIDGASRTWRTVNSITPTSGNGYEVSYYFSGSTYTIYVAYYPDAGAAGIKTVGLSAPSGQQYAIAAIEVKGAASAPSSVARLLRLIENY